MAHQDAKGPEEEPKDVAAHRPVDNDQDRINRSHEQLKRSRETLRTTKVDQD